MPASADAINGVDEELPDLSGEFFELFIREPTEIEGAVNPVEKPGQAANSSTIK